MNYLTNSGFYFKRFLFCINNKEHNKKNNKTLILENLLNMPFIIKYLKSNIDFDKNEFLISLYRYEFKIYNHFNKKLQIKEILINRKVLTLKNVFKIIKGSKFKILEQNFKISDNIILINSKFNWSLFNKLDIECFNLIIKNKSKYKLNILIRPSIIDVNYFDEIILDIKDNLLLDIIKYDKVFNGDDILSAIFNNYNENELSLSMKEKIKDIVANCFLFYTLYFDVLILE